MVKIHSNICQSLEESNLLLPSSYPGGIERTIDGDPAVNTFLALPATRPTLSFNFSSITFVIPISYYTRAPLSSTNAGYR